MKKLPFLTILVFASALVFPSFSLAQGTMGFASSSPNTAAIQSQQKEGQQGKQFLDNLQNKTVTCSSLTDADFEKIGEYFMGQAIGNTAEHIAMNNMMAGMMGVQGEEQTHVAWGKRDSGCDPNASTSQDMMSGGMMGGSGNATMGGWSSLTGLNNQGNNSMMDFGYMPFGLVFMILWWVLIIAGIIALIKWLSSQSHGTRAGEKSSTEILKERYAKGEIDQKEFEEKRKDLQ